MLRRKKMSLKCRKGGNLTDMSWQLIPSLRSGDKNDVEPNAVRERGTSSLVVLDKGVICRKDVTPAQPRHLKPGS